MLLSVGGPLSVEPSFIYDQPKIAASGVIGALAHGMRHQSHHWKIATGGNRHG